MTAKKTVKKRVAGKKKDTTDDMSRKSTDILKEASYLAVQERHLIRQKEYLEEAINETDIIEWFRHGLEDDLFVGVEDALIYALQKYFLPQARIGLKRRESELLDRLSEKSRELVYVLENTK